jgi:hypothetical protein
MLVVFDRKMRNENAYPYCPCKKFWFLDKYLEENTFLVVL